MITITLDINANKTQLASELLAAGYQSSIRDTDNCIDVISDDYDDERVRLLSACDWTQLPDAPLTDTERVTWQQYRQALRDLPQTYPNPSDVIFPEQP
jgi:hypothetical protein